ncbi:unnamed protein product [Mytilus edulis]|uniref:C1q domain-containing protein n=1 Tax=Mytilus edulis TaxID=6550 RepID=A0A8S3QSU1_MYTED|nr:unnamed protein product [Mytilus edulis]
MDQEISKLKKLGSIQPLKEIQTLQHTVQTITAQTNSLSMKERARSQDFLALYNMTTNSLNELEVRTHIKINQLENLTLAQLHDIEGKSEETENRNNLTFSRIQQQINESTEQGDYYIYLNGNIISETRIGYSSSPPSSMYHTGTAVLALQLHPNDSVWVYNPGYSMNGGLYSTLTIVKVK